MKYEKRRLYGVNISIADLEILYKWCDKNDYEVSWCIRRGVKEFIEKYCDSNIVPGREIVNPGAACRKNND